MKPKHNIVLIGFRGSGKSTLAKALLKTGLKFGLYSLDDAIENELGMNIEQFVKTNSWKTFRDLESKHCEQTKTLNRHIIDCGGGVVEREENLNILRQYGVVFWIDTPEATLLKRLEFDPFIPEDGDTKPHANDLRSSWRQLYARRLPLYKTFSDCRIATEGKSTSECAREISSIFLRLRGGK